MHFFVFLMGTYHGMGLIEELEIAGATLLAHHFVVKTGY